MAVEDQQNCCSSAALGTTCASWSGTIPHAPWDVKDGKKGQAPKEAPKERKAWFGRDDKISEMIGLNRQWATATKGELKKWKDDLLKAIAESESTPDVQQAVQTELRLMQNRVKAIKLVLSESVDDDSEATGRPYTALPLPLRCFFGPEVARSVFEGCQQSNHRSTSLADDPHPDLFMTSPADR